MLDIDRTDTGTQHLMSKHYEISKNFMKKIVNLHYLLSYVKVFSFFLFSIFFPSSNAVNVKRNKNVISDEYSPAVIETALKIDFDSLLFDRPSMQPR